MIPNNHIYGSVWESISYSASQYITQLSMKCELSHPRRLIYHMPYTTAKSTTVTLCPLTSSRLCCPKHFNSKNTLLALHCQRYNRKSNMAGKLWFIVFSQLWFWPSSLYWFWINFCNNRSFIHCVESSEERSALFITC